MTVLECGIKVEYIIISEDICFKVGNFIDDDNKFYFTVDESYMPINDLFNIDTDKGFANVKACEKYALKNVQNFLKKHQSLLKQKI